MRNVIILAILGILLFFGRMAQSEPITIAFRGNVTSARVEGISDTFTGTTFTGTYTYDSTADDIGGGHYIFNSPYGIDLFLGGYEFKTSPSQTGQFNISIINDGPVNGLHDYYTVQSQSNVSIPFLDFNIYSINWYLEDSTHTALSSNVLPVTAPVLTKWDYNNFEIYGSDNISKGLLINGIITQVTPEPSSAILIVTGVLFFLRKR
jgi:hypothetical protein